MNKLRYNLWIGIALLVCMVGCGMVSPSMEGDSAGTNQASENHSTQEEPATLGLSPDFQYEVPDMEPSIRMDQYGYLPNSKKIAVFEGEELNGEFQVINKETGECAFTGILENKGYDEGLETYISIGDFTDFITEGTYYLQNDHVGCSYEFVIQENLYDSLLNDAVKDYYYARCGMSLTSGFAGEKARNACHTSLSKFKEDYTKEIDVTGGWHMDDMGNRSVIDGANTVVALLLAYELNPDCFSDDLGIPESGDAIPDLLNEVQYEIEWLLKMQDVSTGAVYESVSVTTPKNSLVQPSYLEAPSVAATESFAVAMAKFGYLFQNFDVKYATKCLQASDRAMYYLNKNMQDVDATKYFEASTELFRATGYQNYHKIVTGFLAEEQNIDLENPNVFLGVVTYLSTKQKVDKKLCSVAMKKLMRTVEDLSYETKKEAYITTKKITPKVLRYLLNQTSQIAVVNYIITNTEYETILEKYIHFFMGNNEGGTCYVEQYGAENISLNDETLNLTHSMEQKAEWILLLSDVIGNNGLQMDVE